MKHIIISIYILLSFIFFTSQPLHAQEENILEQEITQESDEEVSKENTKTLDEALSEDTPTIKLNIFQILVAILAPITFLTIGYLLIKKMKL